MCQCKENFRTKFPAANVFTIYLTGDRKGAPVQWLEDNFMVCILCGEITARVPEAELGILRQSVGESIV